MASKKSYNRFFIILQEEDKGYGMGPDRPPTGYVKVETKSDKSKVTVYAQNLKSFETGECLYRCYLISHQDDRDGIAYLGMMNIDEAGRGESSWETGAEDAFSTKIPVEKYNAAAIVADKEGTERVIAPLAGYMSKEKFEWRSKVTKNKPAVQEIVETAQETVEDRKTVEKAIEVSEVSSKFEEYEKQVTEAVKENEIENVIAEEKVVKEEVQESVEPSVQDVITTVEIPVEQDIPVLQEAVEVKEDIDIEDIIEEEEEEIRNKHKHHDEHEEHEYHEEHEHHEEYKHEKVEKHECPWEQKCDKYKEYEYHDEHKGKKPHKMYDMYSAYGHNLYNQDPCQYCSYSYYCKLNLRHTMKKMLEDMLFDYTEIDMRKDLGGCRVWKVDMEKCRRDGHMVHMYPCYDLLFYPMMYNPSVNYFNYISKHGHYLFGIKYGKDKEVKMLVFGIPGRNKPFEQPFEGKTGFIKWVPGGKGDEGYWIMMYDPVTGIIETGAK